MSKYETFCDDCGDMVRDASKVEGCQEIRAHRTYESLPFDINSTNMGESAVMCLECVQRHEGTHRNNLLDLLREYVAAWDDPTIESIKRRYAVYVAAQSIIRKANGKGA